MNRQNIRCVFNGLEFDILKNGSLIDSFTDYEALQDSEYASIPVEGFDEEDEH